MFKATVRHARVGDVSQYGHAWPDEVNHGNHESWMATRTRSFNEGVFESVLQLDSPIAADPVHDRSAHFGRDVRRRRSDPAQKMDSLFKTKPQEFPDSIGASLNLGVNELADALHTFFLNVVSEDEE